MKIKFTAYNIAIAVILLLILIIVSLFIFVNPNKRPMHKPDVTLNEQKPTTPPKPVFRKDGELRFIDSKSFKVISEINIEVADNDAEREQGLMYRDTMAENDGMLFLMGTEEMQAFWMKNTILPLDIMFVDAERRIVNIQKNCKPYSLDQIPSAKPALYVVEVNAGYADKYGIMAGDLISF
jgi:uncharacterized membrane protein (UPF0127 family)